MKKKELDLGDRILIITLIIGLIICICVKLLYN